MKCVEAKVIRKESSGSKAGLRNSEETCALLVISLGLEGGRGEGSGGRLMDACAIDDGVHAFRITANERYVPFR